MLELTWEQAVEWLRRQPDQAFLVRSCYYDDPLIEAAQRFANSDEWAATRALLPKQRGRALDLGAGRGISSYALALDGWQVTALEPDPSLLVGAGAIRALTEASSLPITIIEEYGESLPLETNMYDLVYGRQVLHHAQDLRLLLAEVSRILKPGGRFIAVREHVISRSEDLPRFLDSHPLHRYYGGEHAFLLSEYTTAISSGLRLKKVLGPLESVINYFPMSYQQWRDTCTAPLVRRLGRLITRGLTSDRHLMGRWLTRRLACYLAQKDNSPGRLYSFIADKEVR